MANTDYVTDNRLIHEASQQRKQVAKVGAVIVVIATFIFPVAWWVFLIAYGIAILNTGVTRLAGAEGENKTLDILKLLPDSYSILNQVYVPNPQSSTGTTEIDFIVLSPKGIFIVEVKHNRGRKIIGCPKGKWTVEKVGQGGKHYSTSMRNPITQLNSQIFALSHYLEIQNCKTWLEGIVYLSYKGVKFTFSGTKPDNVLQQGLAERIVAFEPKYPAKNLEQAKQAIIRLSSAAPNPNLNDHYGTM